MISQYLEGMSSEWSASGVFGGKYADARGHVPVCPRGIAAR